MTKTIPKLTQHSTVELLSGTHMPILGFGTWKTLPNSTARKAVLQAIEVGYRHIDTARIYLNEKGIGEAVRKSHIPREELFVTTKLWNADQGYERTHKAFEKSLKRLGLDYVDLYLMHWPVPELRLESWRAMIEIFQSGRARAIGVSNFTEEHLAELITHSDTKPAVNQVEFHPFLNQKMLLEYCHEQSIILEAYSPLAHGKRMQDTTLERIATKYNKSIVQVMLRWSIQLGNVVIPKSTTVENMNDNLDIFDFVLDKTDMLQIEELNENFRTCWDPTGM